MTDKNKEEDKLDAVINDAMDLITDTIQKIREGKPPNSRTIAFSKDSLRALLSYKTALITKKRPEPEEDEGESDDLLQQLAEMTAENKNEQ